MENIQTRKQIIAEWERQLLEHPADKVTVKSISDACGFSRQTFYYHFDDMEDLIRQVMEGGGDNTLRDCRQVSDIRSGIRIFLSDFLLYLPVARRFKSSKYRNAYESAVTENNRRVIEALIAIVYKRTPGIADDCEQVVDFLSCGLTQTIMEHCSDGQVDIDFLSRMIECTIRAFLLQKD